MLVVDLDNSLVRTDLLYETWFAGLARQPLATLRALAAIAEGKAAFKARLAEEVMLDVASLPYNQDVLALIEAARQAGERTALVSAADQRLVAAVAAHLGCFDEAHGSDRGRNLGGEAKAALLVEHHGERGFDYVGDAPVDLAVWRHARRAITVEAGPRLRRAAERVAPETLHLGRKASAPPRWQVYLTALRPHQWLKNLLVFLPPLAGHASSVEVWAAALIAFIAFCLTASSVYVVNDLLDLEADRAHPRKCARPFAAGALPIAHGPPLAAGLLALGGLVGLAATPGLLAVLAIYYLTSCAYSLILKRLLVVDICTLAALYTQRMIGGAAATGVLVSPWLLVFSAFLFLSLAAMKRQTELVDGVKSGREKTAGRVYEVHDLPIVAGMSIASGYIAVLVLALYINSPAVQEVYRSPWILFGVCPVLLFWISRLVLIAHRGAMDDDPMVFALHDRVSLACAAGALALAAAASLG